MIMQGKKGIIMGMANKFSIAYGIARSLKENGAELIFTVASEYFKEKITSIVEKEFENSKIFVCDVSMNGEIEKTFEKIQTKCEKIDFIVHSIAFSDKNELKGKYTETSRENFLNTMNISCFSFVETCKFAEHIMNENGSIIALTYYGSEKVFPNYNVMGVAKAALESSIRYSARDLGEKGIRVNAISAGPIKTLASSGVGEFSKILEYNKSISPLRRNITQEDVGNTALFLLSSMGSGITGETVIVDCGCSIMGMKTFKNETR